MNLALFPLSCCEPRICRLSKQIIHPVPCQTLALINVTYCNRKTNVSFAATSSVIMNSAQVENKKEEEFVPINDCFWFF